MKAVAPRLRPPLSNPLVQFWNRDLPLDGQGRCIHPDDQAVLSGVLPEQLDAGLRLPPAPYLGPLPNARIVVLGLNPGHSQDDDARAATPEGRHWWRQQRTGSALYDLDSWLKNETEWLGPWPMIRPHIAKLNRYAYASITASCAICGALRALPSSRLTYEWARDELFPAARRGDKVVLVTRAHEAWGVTRDRDEGRALFCSFVSASALPRQEDRPRIIAVVREVLGLSLAPEFTEGRHRRGEVSQNS